jgi:hypothetical protein
MCVLCWHPGVFRSIEESETFCIQQQSWSQASKKRTVRRSSIPAPEGTGCPWERRGGLVQTMASEQKGNEDGPGDAFQRTALVQQEGPMLRLTLIFLLAVWLAACVLPFEIPYNPPQGPAPVSPLIPNQVPVLLENQWRLTEILHDGTRHDFDVIEPILVTFSPGALAWRACGSGGIYFDTRGIEAPNAYRLRHGSMTMVGCLHGGTEQQGDFLRAMYDTNRYAIEGDRLILSGDNAQLTFVIDNEATKPPDWM